MNRRIAFAVLLGLTLLAGSNTDIAEAGPPKKSPDLSGEWRCEGWNMGADFTAKADYEITVAVEAKGKDTYVVKWKLSNGGENVGVGIYDPRTKVFAAGYNVGRSPGVAIYELDKKATVMTCVGTFSKRLGNVAQERWSR